MQPQKEWIRETFDCASPMYGEKACSFFTDFGERLVELARLNETDRVLDVATGKGAVLLPASKRARKIIGIDLSLGMVQELKKRVHPDVQILQMDAEHLTFADRSFDVLFCAFALFFFPNLQATLSEFKRVLKPGGQLAVSVWGKKSPLEAWFSGRVRELGAARTLFAQSLDTPEQLGKVLSGFKDVELREESKIFIHANAEEWWQSLWSRGARSQLNQLSPENLQRLKEEAFLRFEPAQERRVIYGLAHN